MLHKLHDVETVVKLRREITPPYLTTDETVVILRDKKVDGHIGIDLDVVATLKVDTEE